MTSRIGSARKVLPVLFVALALGCGGGGGGGDGGPFEVVAVNVADGDGLPVNQEVRVRFTSAIDAATVQDATVRVREGPDFTRQVPGDVVVNGDTLTFFPKLPALADASDGGFHPGGTYRLELPGFPIALTLASRSGRPLRSTYDTTFRVSSAMPPFFKDPSFGPPRVVGTNPASSVPPPSTPIRAGTFNVPTTLRLLFSEPLRPSSVTSRSIALVARDLAGDDAVPVDLVLEQTNLSVSVAIHPRSPLPENAILEVRAFGDITDLVGNPIRPFASQWRTGDEAPQSSCIEESFDTDANADAVLTNAHWGDVEPGVLSSGYGPGGSGVEGGFDPTSDAVVDADRLPSGDLAVLEFHDVHVPVGVTVHIVGSRPLVLRSATDAVIEGSLILDGGDGSTVTADSDEAGAPGGVGNAGGGAGGSGGCPASATTAISGVAGTGRGAGAGGIDQGRTGGAPGGGGGGGYLTLGDSGDGGGGGLGGTTYGGSSLDPTTGLLLAGSGGGGGACDDDFGTGPNDGGGGAGGGGGAILVVAAGDVIVRGAILARGGRGGDAGQGAGGGG
ncbi:MAG: Ig-like domain-containing protein [Planctomycetes bacterium]|nr:Ig-like domain-containing protein [Planctomycetota bacterium]